MPENLVPLDHRRPGEYAKLFEDFMASRIVGQERSLRYFTQLMELYQAGSRDPRRPIYVALLAGPSGVGKTMTMEALAEFLFGDPTSLTKVACADFQQSHDTSALIGSPPGYVGFWNPDDPMHGGVEPMLSQYSIDRFDYFYHLNKNGGADTEANKKRLNELMNKWNSLAMILHGLGKEERKTKGSRADTKNEVVNMEIVNVKNNAMTLTMNQMIELDIEIRDLMKKVNNKEREYSSADNYRSVILFDEVEKANSALHKLLLEIMDKGQVTLKNGMVTKFKNSFIGMTSNVGSEEIGKILSHKGIGFQPGEGSVITKDRDQDIYESVMRAIAKAFPPEFRGRLDNIVVFRPLEKEHLRKILDLEIGKLCNRLLKIGLPLTFQISEEVKEFLLEKSLKRAEEGARLLRKRIEKYLEENLCRMKNTKELTVGDIVHIQLVEERGKKRVRFFREKRPNEAST